MWAPCIMHRCVIYPVESPRQSFPFSTSVIYPVDPPPPPTGPSHPPPVLPIFHSGSLPRPEWGEVTFFLSFNYCPSGVRGSFNLPRELPRGRGQGEVPLSVATVRPFRPWAELTTVRPFRPWAELREASTFLYYIGCISIVIYEWIVQ